jgi:hypothetical protein
MLGSFGIYMMGKYHVNLVPESTHAVKYDVIIPSLFMRRTMHETSLHGVIVPRRFSYKGLKVIGCGITWTHLLGIYGNVQEAILHITTLRVCYL